MAYREFLNETPYESPVLGDLPRTLQALQFTQQQKLLKQRQLADAANDLKTFQATSTIPKYDRGITQIAGQGTQMRLNELHQGQMTPSQQTKAFLDEAPKLNSLAIANKDELGRLNKQILENTDPYYRKENDLKQAADILADTGEPFGVDLLNKDADKISRLRQSLNDDENVMQNYAADKAASDWVQKHKLKTFETNDKGQSGAKYGSTISGLFFDKNGKPGITDEHITDFLNYHPKQKPYYTHLAMNDIMADIKKARAADPNFMKDLDDGEALSAIIQNPSLDPVNKQPVNERAREKAKETIKSLESITRKVDTDLSDSSSSSRYGVTSKDIATAEGFDSKEFSGPARTITNTKSAVNPYLTYSSAAPVRMDLATKEVNTNGLSQQFKLKSTKWVPVDAKGIPIPIQAANIDELIERIKNLPYGTVANAKIAFEGDSLNGDVLDLAYTKRNELDAQYAIDQDPKTKATLDKLTETMENLRLGKDYNTEFLNQLLHVKVNKHELIPVDPGDENTRFVQSQTGMDVYSDKAQTPDMIRVRNAIQQKIRDDQQPVKEIKQIVEDVNKMPTKKGGKPKQAEEVEQDGNIFKLDSATGQYKFSRKK